ncbi:nucleoside triphosphate pyrophosphatase [Gilvimarinus sp. DA14]|uniref:Maf family protein n=1 Tax=Gilvimarinus sp. DA14 TaxID=2956798 RepID=UPI0020B6968D|nr:Maf family nucleotide pyrophosphatase [Gilvimarinus sp. DA14]UTF60547.1 Maf family nucleotide pyrophosphatase [Gilvimarinus sp. DA14]
MQREIVLASSSPQRRELLKRLNLPFTAVSPEIDEAPIPHETPHELALRLAQQKAEALAATYPSHLIIGSDQVASLDGTPCSKPGNHEKALAQLQAASGKKVTFYTGLCLLDSLKMKPLTAVESFSVYFRPLTTEQIDYYLRQDQPYDCAGSFKCEALGISLFERLEGDDPNALIGLPLIRLTQLLGKVGIDVLKSQPSDARTEFH